MFFDAIAAVALTIWLYLIVARGGFWLCRERDGQGHEKPVQWPTVAVVIPARNEADCIGESLGSLLRQNYPGKWAVILVDDNSSDGTADVARRAANGGNAQLQIVNGAPLPGGWTGKLWALKQGIDAAEVHAPDYLLLTDADIAYAPDVLSALVTLARAEGLVLTSLMVKLNCESFAEKTLIPAFVFFFQMLYPFAWVNRKDNSTAAAAGGCMLIRADVLGAAGGIGAVRNALIDDCALAKLLKPYGPIRLSLTEKVHSIRPYPAISDIRRMVARSAYAQLQYSPLLLVGTVLGMALVYLAPPLIAILGNGLARWLGLTAWILMAVAFVPTLRLYRLSPLWGFALPAIALCYMLFTIDSALQYTRGTGGMWKGRVQATGP
jgi:hopene-associated glycosyltransferase HpnB